MEWLALDKTAGSIQCNKESKYRCHRLLDFVERAYGHFLCIFPIFFMKKEICSSADDTGREGGFSSLGGEKRLENRHVRLRENMLTRGNS